LRHVPGSYHRGVDVLHLTLLAGLLAALALAAVSVARARIAERDNQAARDLAGDAADRSFGSAHGATRVLVAQRDDAERRLAFVRTAVDQSSVGVAALGPELQILFATSAARRLLDGRHGDAAAGVRIRTLAEEVIASGTPGDVRFEVYEPARRMLQVQADPLPRDIARGVIVNVVDVTEQQRIDAIRQDFVANVSHELKTPVGALAVLAEAIADTDDDVARKRLAERLVVEAGRVARLVDDILDLSLVERERPPMAPIDLAAVVGTATRRVSVVAEDMSVEVVAEFPDTPVVVSGDRLQLVSAVANLLDNAVKYGTVRGNDDAVVVRVIDDDDCGMIEVEDHGIGIASRHTARIFERFYRIDRSRSRSRGGTGLGLAIVRHVALNHGGSIDVDSSPGAGSTFRLRIPKLPVQETTGETGVGA
jgi:two-component system sensor histidine kinase SenX3